MVYLPTCSTSWFKKNEQVTLIEVSSQFVKKVLYCATPQYIDIYQSSTHFKIDPTWSPGFTYIFLKSRWHNSYMLVIPFISAIMSWTATKKSPSLKGSLDHLRCKNKVALDCQAQIKIQLMCCFKKLEGYASAGHVSRIQERIWHFPITIYHIHIIYIS